MCVISVPPPQPAALPIPAVFCTNNGKGQKGDRSLGTEGIPAFSAAWYRIPTEACCPLWDDMAVYLMGMPSLPLLKQLALDLIGAVAVVSQGSLR